MNIKINGITYESATWNGTVMEFETNMTLAEIESSFTPTSGYDIEVYDGEREIAKYINKGIESMTVTGAEPRTVTVQFNVTQITETAEAEIRESIDDSDGAIAELAEIVAAIDNYNLEDMWLTVTSHQETINTWFSNASELQQFIVDLRKKGGILDMLDARITALEHEIGIASVEMNEEE